MKKLISLVLCICVLLTAFTACGTPGKANGTFTLMVYMVGSDLESKSMAASNDISEMLDSGYDADKLNVVLYTGGTDMWYADIPSDTNATLLLDEKDGEKQLKLLSTADELRSMGDPGTLTDFLNDCLKNHPADRYGLILWDHGSGPLIGFGKDICFSGDNMELSELKTALDASGFKDDNKLEFVGFDACLMSSVEVAETLRPHAKYLIASQETEPGDGWDYSFLSKFNETSDAAEIAESAINAYTEHYEQEKDAFNDPNLTLACMDLSKMEAVTEAMNKLFSEMNGSLNGGGYQQLAEDRASLNSFGDSSSGSRGWSLDLVDMDSFAEICEKDFPGEAKALRDALGQLVVCNKTNLSGAAGISMYYPYDGANVYAMKGVDKFKTFFDIDGYKSYMNTFAHNWSDSWLKADNTVEQEVEEFSDDDLLSEDGSLTVKLSDDQKKSFSKAYLNIFEKGGSSENGYRPILYHKQLQRDDDGNVTISGDERIPSVGGRLPFCLVQTSQDSEKACYRSFDTAVTIGADITDLNWVTLQCTVKNGSGDIIVNSLEYADGSKNSDNKSMVRDGKNTLDAKNYSHFVTALRYCTPKYYSDGTMMKFDDWEGYLSMYRITPIDNDMQLKMTRVSDFVNYDADDFCYQIEITDTSGKTFLTELKNFEKKEKPETVTEKTPHGKLTFEVREKYAMLTKYEGTDSDVTVPEAVEDVPVTEIVSGAFYDKDNYKRLLDSVTVTNPDTRLTGGQFTGVRKVILPDGLKNIPAEALSNLPKTEEIVIPDSVERIGALAFSGDTSLKKLSLPKDVNYIGTGAFKDIYLSGVVSFRGESAYYVLKDGMLTDKKGKTLLAVFTGKGETSVTIPEGVEHIMPYAHCVDDDQLTEIRFPSTLKSIGFNAFSGNIFNELIFPDGLREIGSYAFGAGTPKKEETSSDSGSFFSDFTLSFKQVHTVKTVSFGKNLSRLGKTILGKCKFNELSVSESNRFYSVKDNRLTNKSKTADLSETALSSFDNLEKNSAEYKLYLHVTEGLNLKNYQNSKYDSDNKTYMGNEYCLSSERREGDYTSLKLDSGITLDGKKYELPCRLSELLDNGLKLRDEDNDGVNEATKLKADKYEFESVWAENKSGESVVLYARNYGDSEKALRDCEVFKINIYRNEHSFDVHRKNKQDEMFPFEYHGITMDSSVQDVYKAFGEPARFYITDNAYSATLTFKEYAGENEYKNPMKNGEVEISFDYDSETDTLKLSDINIERGKEPTYY